MTEPSFLVCIRYALVIKVRCVFDGLVLLLLLTLFFFFIFMGRLDFCYSSLADSFVDCRAAVGGDTREVIDNRRSCYCPFKK